MFSGIIEYLKPVSTAERLDRTPVLVVETGWTDLELGESIALNGVCLTVTSIGDKGTASFFVSRCMISTATNTLPDCQAPAGSGAAGPFTRRVVAEASEVLMSWRAARAAANS